jgi:hypothetical protein
MAVRDIDNPVYSVRLKNGCLSQIHLRRNFDPAQLQAFEFMPPKNSVIALATQTRNM